MTPVSRGRRPSRPNVETSWIHRGDEDWGGGNRNILIHTDRGEQWENGDYVPGGPGNYVEEALLHESAPWRLRKIALGDRCVETVLLAVPLAQETRGGESS